MKEINRRNKPPIMRGEAHPAWTGDNVSYAAAHLWLAKYHSDKKEQCEHCPATDRLEFAKQHDRKYTRNIEDYLILCRVCHAKYDGNFTAINSSKTHCPKGHLLAGDNLFQSVLPRRACRRCAAEQATRYALEHEDKVAKAKREWKERNREAVRKSGREYYYKNKEKYAENQRRRRAAARSSRGGQSC